MLPLRENVIVYHFIRKEKEVYAEVAKIYSKNESSVHEIVKKGKNIMLVLLLYLTQQKIQPQCMIRV